MQVKHRDGLKFYNKNRYSGRRWFNSFLSFIWSIFVFVALAVLGVIVFHACTPWLTMLWDTISGK